MYSILKSLINTERLRGAAYMAPLILILLLISCSESTQKDITMAETDGVNTDERGPNNGIMLRDGDFELELAIFETGVPPEYRACLLYTSDAADE